MKFNPVNLPKYQEPVIKDTADNVSQPLLKDGTVVQDRNQALLQYSNSLDQLNPRSFMPSNKLNQTFYSKSKKSNKRVVVKPNELSYKRTPEIKQSMVPHWFKRRSIQQNKSSIKEPKDVSTA